MKIRKAIITSAGKGQRTIPLQTFVDRDGRQKSALQILIEEATSSGVEEIGVVICPGDKEAYQHAAGDHAGRLQFIEQAAPRGYGHALYSAKAFGAGEPFLHLVSDHLPLSTTDKRCAQQLVEVASAENCAVSAVQPTRETMLAHFGAVGGTRVPKRQDLYEVENVLEKPTPTEAEQSLIVPGLRAGHYLCFFGLHVLTASVMDLLGQQVSAAKPGQRVELSPSLAKLAAKERYLAMEVQGVRYNIGVRHGLLFAQLALSLDGTDREEILAQLVDLLATRERTQPVDSR